MPEADAYTHSFLHTLYVYYAKYGGGLAMAFRRYIVRVTTLILCFLYIQGMSFAYALPSCSARSAILIEKTTGRVLYAKNPDEKLPMASTTKIMTAICAIERENAERIVEISERASGVEGSSMYLETGEKMTVKELVYGLMLSSGNDAAVAIAESIAGEVDAFVDIMNKKAAEIGMASTHFMNPNGLPDDGHYSTARDMAKITAYALSDPVFAEVVSTKSYKITGEGKAYPRTLTNHNKLLKMYDGCVGVKTGFTKVAGRCLVSAATRDGMTLIAVTLNAPNDWQDHTEMFNYGFENYKYTKVASKDFPISAIEIDGSLSEIIPVYPSDDVYLPLKDGERAVEKKEVLKGLSAPLKSGEAVGRFVCYVSEENEQRASDISAEAKLVLRSDIKSASYIKKIGVGMGESVKKIFGGWLSLFVPKDGN